MLIRVLCKKVTLCTRMAYQHPCVLLCKLGGRVGMSCTNVELGNSLWPLVLWCLKGGRMTAAHKWVPLGLPIAGWCLKGRRMTLLRTSGFLWACLSLAFHRTYSCGQQHQVCRQSHLYWPVLLVWYLCMHSAQPFHHPGSSAPQLGCVPPPEALSHQLPLLCVSCPRIL